MGAAWFRARATKDPKRGYVPPEKLTAGTWKITLLKRNIIWTKPSFLASMLVFGGVCKGFYYPVIWGSLRFHHFFRIPFLNNQYNGKPLFYVIWVYEGIFGGDVASYFRYMSEQLVQYKYLGGETSNIIVICTPIWGNDPIWLYIYI